MFCAVSFERFRFSSQGGLQHIAKSLSLGKSTEIRLCREQKESTGTSVFGINKEFVVNVEMSIIFSGRVKLQGINPRFF